MRTRVRNESVAILLVEEHPVRSRLYSECLGKAGYKVVVANFRSFSDIRQTYGAAVVSIPDAGALSQYTLLMDALPSHVPCVVLTLGPLPLFLSGYTQLVGHVNRAETHPNDLSHIVRSIIAK